MDLIKDINRDTLVIGKEYGNVTVLEYSGYESKTYFVNYRDRYRSIKIHYWKIHCNVCGKDRDMQEKSILINPKSCGCNQLNAMQEARSKFILKGSEVGSYKHGKSTSKLYNILKRIKSMCNSDTSVSYHNFGEKGITVCDEWLDS